MSTGDLKRFETERKRIKQYLVNLDTAFSYARNFDFKLRFGQGWYEYIGRKLKSLVEGAKRSGEAISTLMAYRE